MSRVHSIIRHLLAAILIVCAYWNIWTFIRNVGDLPARDSNDLIVQEERYRGIRESLLAAGYGKGHIRFLTNRTLNSEPETGEDDYHWGQAQYGMAPWILLMNGKAVGRAAPGIDPPFVIGDFWDGEPAQIPQNLNKLYDSGKGVVLFQKKGLP